MKAIYLLIILVLITSKQCTNQNKRVDSLYIGILTFNVSNRIVIDFKKNVITIYDLNGNKRQRKFSISEEMKLEIEKAYYDCQIDKLDKKNYFKGKCNRFPISITEILVQTNSGVKELKIEEDCRLIKTGNYNDAKKFENIVLKILDKDAVFKSTINITNKNPIFTL